MKVNIMLNKPIIILSTIIMLVYFLSGCGASSVRDTDDNIHELVWPKPPEVPRIRFVREIRTQEDMKISTGFIDRLFGFDNAGVQKHMLRPYGITSDADGRLYIIDTYYKVVRVFDEKRRTYHTFPKRGSTELTRPIDIVAGTLGRLYVSDSEAGVIHVYTDAGKQYVKSIGKGILRRPTGLAFQSAAGELIVADTISSTLVVFNEKTLEVKKTIGKEATGADGFHYPTNIAVSSDHIYVTDSLNFRIQVLNPDYEFIASFGAAGDIPGNFSRPKGIAVDRAGHVYIVDALFGNVQIFDSEGKLLLAFGSPGSNKGEFWLPNAIHIDDQNRIYISDSYNDRVQVFQFIDSEALY